MEKELNKLLADLVVEYHKLQSFHWYLKGYHFFDDHKKFEEYYGDIADAVDGVAGDGGGSARARHTAHRHRVGGPGGGAATAWLRGALRDGRESMSTST